MSADESFVYGSETIGGAAPTHATDVLDHYMFTTNEDVATFVCRFVINASSYADLTTKRALVEAALRTRYQKLTVNFGASVQHTYDPALGATLENMGFDQEPELEKVRDFPNSGLAQAYEFRLRVGRPPNYTDAFGAAAGRRQVDVNLHTDVTERRVVTMTGEWTQVPSVAARAQFLAAFDGASGYASYRLGLVDNTATWALTRREESDPNSLAVLRFTREYSEHIHGRRISAPEIAKAESGLRLVTIRGTYLRTITGSNPSVAASVNYADVTNGGKAFAVATLAALTTDQGGALVVGQGCELLTETATPNEQDDRLDYALVYRELNFKQSSAAGAFLDDPNVVGDRCVFASVFNPTADSPEPGDASSVPGPGAGGGASPGLGSLGNLSTGSAGPGAILGGTGGKTSTSAKKPVDLFVAYSASIKKTVTDLRAFWIGTLLPYLLSRLQDQLGFSGSELARQEPRFDPTTSRIEANLHVRAYTGDIVLFVFHLGRVNDAGVWADEALTGTEHEYNVQEVFPRAAMTRRIECVYRASSSFSLDKYVTPKALEGWVKLTDSQPDTVTKIMGIPAQGVLAIALTYATLEEQLLWVARNVAGGKSGGGGAANNAGALGGAALSPRNSFMPGT